MTTRTILAVTVVTILGALVMSWFWKSNKGGAWDLASVQQPWEGDNAIYDHIRKHIAADTTGLTEGGVLLPDEKDDGKPKWVAGGMDGAFGHHAGSGSEKSRAKMLHRALKVVTEDASAIKLKKLYEQLLQEGVLDFIDPLLERIVEKQDINTGRLEELALWIAKNAPDREPIKFAIAILGVISDSDHNALLLTLGRHEEFTLYVVVALSNMAKENTEHMLFELVQHVDGWGRIQIVERLADTVTPEIKKWMLSEGYQNSIMYEYLAYTCAVAGDLRTELEKDRVAPSILEGAAEIIAALITGGPAEDMDDYADGAIVVQRYLHHVGQANEIEQLLALDQILGFLDEKKADWGARETRGWTPALREQTRTQIEAIKGKPHWKETIAQGLASTDRMVFARAAQAAKALDIDTWEHRYTRLESGLEDGGWYFVMQTNDPSRIDRVVSLAEKMLPLDQIASGPGDELGLGPKWIEHGQLSFVLQDLRRFPEKGWSLIQAGIRSPVVNNQHMALKALSTWGMDKWPPAAKALLEKTLTEAPREDVRTEIETLLAGNEIEEPQWD